MRGVFVILRCQEDVAAGVSKRQVSRHVPTHATPINETGRTEFTYAGANPGSPVGNAPAFLLLKTQTRFSRSNGSTGLR